MFLLHNTYVKWIIWLIAGIGAFLLAGYIYQTTDAQRDLSTIKPLGKLFTVNDYQIHLHCTGSGSPTVILEAREGGLASSWGWIQPEVTKKTRVCSYERRGMGWSTGNNTNLDLEQAAKDLHAALWAAQLQDKYILVGHGLGGVYARKYQERYPEEVVGIVLVDASNPAQVITTPDIINNAKSSASQYKAYSALSMFGLTRIYYDLQGKSDFHALPEREKLDHQHFWSNPHYYDQMANEYTQVEKLYAQGEDFSNVDPLPVRIISAANATQEWERLQNDLFRLSKDSSRITIPDSTQSSLLFNKDHAARVSTVINNLVDNLKNSNL
jgi:pimeloyl-ACP methyl ester carboxylesterase